MFDAISVSGELIAFFESDAIGIVGVVNGDRFAAVGDEADPQAWAKRAEGWKRLGAGIVTRD